MQFTVNTAVLADTLAWVTKSLPVRPSAPILAGLKMTVEQGVLSLVAFDYDQSTVANIPVDDGRDGSVIVAGKLFADITRAMPKGLMTAVLTGSSLEIKAGKAKFALHAMPVEDYPSLPAHPEPSGSVDAREFAEAVRQVAAAAGRDDMLPVLTAVYIHADTETGVMTLAATDRFRLAVKRFTFAPLDGAPSFTALVPARTVEGWAKSLAGGEGDRFVFGSGGDSSSVFAIRTETRSATARLIDGQYPNFTALIPTTFSSQAVIGATETTGALKRVALVAEKATPCAMSFDADGLHVAVAGDSEAFEEIGAEHTGDPVSIRFNIGFLLDGLSAVAAENATLSLVSASKPAVLRPVGDDDDFTYLLMPTRGAAA